MKGIHRYSILCRVLVTVTVLLGLSCATALAERQYTVSLVNSNGTMTNTLVAEGSRLAVGETWNQADFEAVNGHAYGLPVIPESENMLYLGVLVNDQFCYVKSIPITYYREDGADYPGVLKSDAAFEFAGVSFDSTNDNDWLGGKTADAVTDSVFEDDDGIYFGVKKNPFGCYYMIPKGDAGKFYTVQRIHYNSSGSIAGTYNQLVQCGASAQSTGHSWDSEDWKNVTRRLILYSGYNSGSNTITWLDADGTVLHTQTCGNAPAGGIGGVPTYGGPSLTGKSDADHVYTLIGWSPEPAVVSGDATYTAVYSAVPRQYKLTVSREFRRNTIAEPEVYTVNSGDSVEVQLDTYIKNYTPTKTGTELVTVQGGDLTYVVSYTNRKIPLQIYAMIDGEYRICPTDDTYYVTWINGQYGIYSDVVPGIDLRPHWSVGDYKYVFWDYENADKWLLGTSLDNLSHMMAGNRTGTDRYLYIGYSVVNGVDDLVDHYCAVPPYSVYYTVTFNYPSDLSNPESEHVSKDVLVREGDSATPPVSDDNWGWDNGAYQNVTGRCTVNLVQGIKVEPPIANTGLVYNGAAQTGVNAGEHYTLTGETAVDAGTHTAIATLDEGYFWSDGSPAPRQIEYTIARAKVTLTGAGQALPYTGELQTISGVTAAGLFDEGAVVTGVSWSAEGTDVGSYAGAFTGVPAVIDGQGVDRTSNYSFAYSQSGKLSITRKNIANAEVTLAQNTYVADGKGQTPAVTAVKLDGTTLQADTDYTVSWSDNIYPGTAKVTVTGKGNYAGTAMSTFTITGVDISGATVLLRQTEWSYSCQAIRPEVALVTLNSKSVTGYKVSYEDNIDVGTGRVLVTGQDIYTGTAVATFNIRSMRRAAEPDTDNMVEWAPYSTSYLPSITCHIYMTGNSTLSQSFSGYSTLYLDLRGFTITTDSLSQLGMGQRLVVLDSVGGGMVKCASTSGSSVIGVYMQNGGEFDLYGGTISGFTNSAVYIDGGGSFTMYGGTLKDNVKADYNGNGGAIYCNRGNVHILDGVISGNKGRYGGAIYCDASNLYISGGEIRDNNATSSGGGIYYRKSYTSDAGDFRISGGVISGNRAGNYGGGLYVYYSTIDMSGGQIDGNYIYGNSNTSGAGIMNYRGIVNLSGTAAIVENYFTANTSRYNYGGGVCNEGALHIDSGTRIEMNRAGSAEDSWGYHKGAGIFNASNGTLIINGGSICNNAAANGNGGGIYNDGNDYGRGRVEIRGGLINGNQVSSGYGGGIYNNGTLSITGGSICSNTASYQGSAIYNGTGASVTVSGEVTVTDNTSENGQNAIWPGPVQIVGALNGSTISNGTAGDGAVLVGASDGIYELTDQDAAVFTSEDGKGGFLRAWDHQIYVGTEPRYALTLTGAHTDAGETFLAGTEVTVLADAAENQILLDWQSSDESRPIEGTDTEITVLVPDSDVSVTARILDKPAIEAPVYDGTAREPGFSVVLNGVTLEKDMDYTLEYADNVNAGKATVTITAVAEPVWSAAFGFEIMPAPVRVTGNSGEIVYDGAVHRSESYTVQGLPNGAAVTGVNYVVAGTDAGTWDGVFTGEAAVMNADGADITDNCAITLEAGSLVIRPRSMADVDIRLADESGISYTGAAVEPVTRVILNDTELIQEDDYTVEYADNVNAGTARVTLTGMGNYTGSVEKTFIIHPISVETATLTIGGGGALYTGEPIIPGVRVLVNGRQLTADEHYTLSYADNVNAGTAKVVVTGKGNYTGAVQGTFEIIDAQMLTTLSLPAGLQTIGEEAFAAVPAQRIVVPEGCGNIDARAFADCDELKLVELPASVTAIARNAFEHSDVCILAPEGSNALLWARSHGLLWIAK